jgi:hypothetical protein
MSEIPIHLADVHPVAANTPSKKKIVAGSFEVKLSTT